MKPCPFCGSDRVSVATGLEQVSFYYVECERCGGSGPGCDERDEAIETWNQRSVARASVVPQPEAKEQ